MIRLCLVTSMLFAVSFLANAGEVVRNGRVIVTEVTLQPGDTETLDGAHPSVTVYFGAGSLETGVTTIMCQAGQATFAPARARTIRNMGSSPIHYARIELLGTGKPETWGRTGLAPNYKLLFENQFARVYEIRIPAHSNEPQHTHHDRVVVCLSGARLSHKFPDGHEEPSTLKTGEIAWRKGSTHIGQNLGDTALWVIAVEPR